MSTACSSVLGRCCSGTDRLTGKSVGVLDSTSRWQPPPTIKTQQQIMANIALMTTSPNVAPHLPPPGRQVERKQDTRILATAAERKARAAVRCRRIARQFYHLSLNRLWSSHNSAAPANTNTVINASTKTPAMAHREVPHGSGDMACIKETSAHPERPPMKPETIMKPRLMLRASCTLSTLILYQRKNSAAAGH